MATTPTIWIPTAEQASVCRDCELAAYGSAATVRQWRSLLANRSVVALCHGKRPTAVAVAKSTESGWQLLLVAVRPTARRRGIGSTLVKLLGEKSLLTLRLRETATAALKFAVACGFHPLRVDRDSYGDCDAVILTRNPE